MLNDLSVSISLDARGFHKGTLEVLNDISRISQSFDKMLLMSGFKSTEASVVNGFHNMKAAGTAATAQMKVAQQQFNDQLATTVSQLRKVSTQLTANNASMAIHNSQLTKSTSSFSSGLAAQATGLSLLSAGFGAAAVALSIAAITKESIKAGIQLERLEVQFRTVFGTMDAGRQEFAFVREESKRLGLELQSTAQGYARFSAAVANTSIEGQKARDIFTGFSEGISAMRLTAEQGNLIFYALQQMMSKGKVSSEELNRQLGETLPGALQIAADAMGKTRAELLQMMKKGELMADDLLPRMAEQMHKTFAKGAAEAANSATGEINRFNNSLFESKAALGTALIPALNDVISTLSPVIAQLKEAVKWTLQLSVSFAAGMDKIAAAKEVGWIGLATEKGRADFKRQSAIIDEAGYAQFREVEKRFTHPTVTPGKPSPHKPSTSSPVTGKTGRGGSSVDRTLNEYTTATKALDKALRAAQLSIHNSGLDELSKSFANVDGKALNLTEQYEKLFTKFPQLKGKIEQIRTAEREAAEKNYLTEHFKEINKSIRELDGQYEDLLTTFSKGSLASQLQSSFRSIDEANAETLKAMGKLGKGDEFLAKIQQQKDTIGKNLATDYSAQIERQIQDAQRDLSNQMNLNSISGSLGNGFFDAAERDALRASQSIKNQYAQSLKFLENVIM